MTKHRRASLLLIPILMMSACGSDGGTPPPGPGSIHVTATTTGDDFDLDGYLVLVGADDPRSLVPNDTLKINHMDAGSYMVALQEVAANCVADGSVQNIMVSEESVTVVPFDVSCTELPPATVDVTGTWEGRYEGRDHVDNVDRSGTIYYELTQSGDDVTGKTWSTSDELGTTSPDFPATGRVSGNELELFVLGWTEVLISWQVRVTHRGVLSGTEMTGTSTEQRGAYTGTWTVTRQ